MILNVPNFTLCFTYKTKTHNNKKEKEETNRRNNTMEKPCKEREKEKDCRYNKKHKEYHGCEKRKKNSREKKTAHTASGQTFRRETENLWEQCSVAFLVLRLRCVWLLSVAESRAVRW